MILISEFIKQLIIRMKGNKIKHSLEELILKEKGVTVHLTPLSSSMKYFLYLILIDIKLNIF